MLEEVKKKNIARLQNAEQSTFLGCQGVKLFLPKDCVKFCQNLNCQNLILSFVTISVFGLYHNSSYFFFFSICIFLVLFLFELSQIDFWVFSQYEF